MVEVTVEQQILGEIRGLGKSVDKIERNQELMSVKLLGGLDEDTKHGRLPIVETKVDDHDSRIESLELDRVRWKAYAIAAAAIGGVMGSVASSLIHAALAVLGKN
jgi:hypothetical protein